MKRLLSLIALPTSLFAAELPPPVIPAGVGVNIHFTRGREADLDMIAAAGFKFVRMDFTWQGIERKKGEYDWSAYDELTANLEKRGLRALYILDYSNPLYEEAITITDKRTKKERRDTASPQRPESVEAFARWAGAAAKRFRGRRIIWEIWNEPNISFWKPKPDVNQYIALALATCKAVRAADPKATIVAPASSGFPWEFFEAMFASGLLKYLDAVSVHPYRPYSRPPETAASDYAKLRGLIAKHAPAGKKNLLILSGEWGYATHEKGVSPETQAAFIVRQQLANLLNGVPLSIWYDWKNDGTDPAYNEHNFGTVTHDLKPKPSYLALQAMTRELSGYRIARRLKTASEDDYVLRCVNKAGQEKLTAWTLGDPHALDLDLPPHRLKLELGPAPRYVALRQPPRELAPGAAGAPAQPLDIAGLRAVVEGDDKVPAKADIAPVDAPDGAQAPVAKVFKLDYEFADGWRFLRCVSNTKERVQIAGRPRAFGLWVRGDQSGNSLRLRLTDSTGQTFQPAGPTIDWSGWRWVTMDLSDLRKAGHWGGANDGVVHWPLRWDSPLLLDGHRRKTKGTIYFAGMMLVYD
jgi:hypothetical protein